MKKHVILLIVVFTIFSCKINECEDIACFTPPPNFAFELVDKTTGENLFTNGTLKDTDIEVLDENEEKVTFKFISENNINIIDLPEIGWNLDLHTYTITVGPTVEFRLELEMEEKHENCCTFFKVITFNISNYTYEQSSTTGVYSIKID